MKNIHDILIEVMWSCGCGASGGPFESEMMAEDDAENHVEECEEEPSDG